MAKDAAMESVAGEYGRPTNVISLGESEFHKHGRSDRKTVRDGNAYDIDSTVPIAPSDAARAAKVKEELGDFVVTDLSDRPVYKCVKRVFDVVFSGAVLVCFSWLYLLIALLVKIDDPKGPVFFKQRRVGMNGVEFDMLKFRSMCVDAESRLDELRELNEKTGPVFKIKEDPRITRVGKWLRKLSLDELPQFINVFVGDIPWVILGPSVPTGHFKTNRNNSLGVHMNNYCDTLSHLKAVA